ncbi:MAG: hypothetical protein IPL86_07035 [Flavobacteriales bacterium]|nr:hypothetical protein [Flavobacteriales bacterium]
MKLIRTLAAFAAIGLSMLTAHAQFQVVHDAPNTTSTPKLTPLMLSGWKPYNLPSRKWK